MVRDIDRLVDQLAWLGGVADRGRLGASKGTLTAALASGQVRRLRRGRYALPVVADARCHAAAASGVLSHMSAAVVYGWALARAPRRTHVMVPRDRHPRAGALSRDIVRHVGVLTVDKLSLGVTGPVRTVTDCARVLPFGEALAVADSALRSGIVGAEELQRAAARTRGPGAARVRRVAQCATPLAANPFESGARAICLDVPLLAMTPQVQIVGPGLSARVDLADLRLGLVVEADGYEFHGGREGFVRDRRRYTGLTQLDWVVFAYVHEDVFRTPGRTRDALITWSERQVAVFPAGRPGLWRASVVESGQADVA